MVRIHFAKRTYCEKFSTCFYAWSIKNTLQFKALRNSGKFKPFNTSECDISPYGLPNYLDVFLHMCGSESFKCGSYLLDKNGRELLSNLATCTGSQSILRCNTDEFKNLKILPGDALQICCFFIQETSSPRTCVSIPEGGVYRRKLVADLKPMVSTEEKLDLRVGKETLTVNKAVLCARSPVFASMFQSKMREQLDNTVTITDVQLSVMRSFVCFLYGGTIPNGDFEHVCELYYAADKYGFSELREACVRLLRSTVTIETAFRMLSLSERHSDKLLKFYASVYIFVHRETIVKRDDWKTLMDVQPKLALEAITIF